MLRREAMLRKLLLLLALAAALPAAAEEPFKLVVHPGNPATSLPRAEVSLLFLKKVTRWPDGKVVQPVEPADERLHERFCREVHGKSPAAVQSYWNQLIFSGREVPPLEKATAEEVLAYVRANPGAIGVVPAGEATPGVKVLALKE